MNLIWKAEDVLKAVSGQSLHTQDWQATGVSIDSRSVNKGDLFIAIQGPSFDGHDFVHQAFEAGATAAIVKNQPPQVPPDAPLIFVDDTFEALQALGNAGRARTKAKIIAVTGSVGKTSCKEQLRLMLGMVKDTFANEGSLNNHWGVPLSLARLPENAIYGVLELGMNHLGEMKDLSKRVRPHIALINNVEAVHLEHFESTDEIADAKAEIFDGMEDGGIAILNKDNKYYDRLVQAARDKGVKRILSFGENLKADSRLIELNPTSEGSDVKASILGDELSFYIGSPGNHLVKNALGTLLTCVAAGADAELCSVALKSYRPPAGRGTNQNLPLPTGRGSFTILDESFNASPVATLAALDNLGQSAAPGAGRRIAVLGDMKELGPTAKDLHLALLEGLIKNKIDLVHCCGEMMGYLYDILPPLLQGHKEEDADTLAPLVTQDVQIGDVFMVKGSHSMHMEKIVQALQDFSKA